MAAFTGLMEKGILYIGNRLSSSKNNPTTHQALEKALKAEGFQIFSASHFENIFLRQAHMIFVFFRFINKFDRVLIDTYSTRNFWYAIIIAKLSRIFNKHYIPILHGGNLENRFKNSPGISKQFLNDAYKIVSPSIYLQKVVQEMGYSNVEQIPNPFFLKNYTFKSRQQFQPKLLWVRAFDEIYNPLLALKTLEILLNEFPEAHLCMVGPEKDKTLGLCKQEALQKKLPVTFKGKLGKKEWANLSEGYDVFLNTANIDNVPVSVLEAMALGLSVISTKVGGISYVLKDGVTGLLVPPSNAKKMAGAVAQIMEDKEGAGHMSWNARKEVEKLDWDFIKPKWIKVLT